MNPTASVGRITAGGLWQRAKPHVFSAGGIISIGTTLLDASQRRRENPNLSPGQALLGAGTTFALAELFGWKYILGSTLVDVGKAVGEMSYQGYYAAPYQNEMLAGPFGALNPIDTAQMATMRQRSLAALAQSRMNARSILGSEARMLHRNQVTY